ncbi:TPA: phage morphogenesis protein, partial [Shigella flexneri]
RIGSPLDYARIMNDGFSGSVPVSAHKRLISQCFGRALKYPVWQTVGAHHRMMNIPQREFLGLSSASQQELQQVISHFWKEVLP